MKKFYNFLPTKAEEESRGGGRRKRGEAVPSTDVEIREMGPGTRTVHLIDQWKIRKVITPSDVASSLSLAQEGKGFEVVEENILRYLPKNAVENVLAGGEVTIRIKDVDEGTYHDNMKLSKRSYTNGFIIKGHWTRDFVVRRSLQPGQVVGLCWNVAENCLDFSVLKPLGTK